MWRREATRGSGGFIPHPQAFWRSPRLHVSVLFASAKNTHVRRTASANSCCPPGWIRDKLVTRLSCWPWIRPKTPVTDCGKPFATLREHKRSGNRKWMNATKRIVFAGWDCPHETWDILWQRRHIVCLAFINKKENIPFCYSVNRHGCYMTPISGTVLLIFPSN